MWVLGLKWEFFQQWAVKSHRTKPIERKPLVSFALGQSKIFLNLTFCFYKFGIERTFWIGESIFPNYFDFISPG